MTVVGRRFAGLSAALASLALAACGGSGGSSSVAGGGSAEEPAAVTTHVHGLGVNPRDRALIIATHTGLFRAAEQAQQAQPYGQSRQDVMGFSILGADRFIGSGHPDPRRSDQPPSLGLIASPDAGRTWASVSLAGEADFHVLESQGRQVYGFDGSQGRLMVSRNGGHAWSEHRPPAAMFALAIDPEDAKHVVASTERGIFTSSDEGATWRTLSTRLAGLLAWPAKDRLLLVDGTGAIQSSGDGGGAWRSGGSIGGPPAAFIASGKELYAALSDNTVQRSKDGGATWQLRAKI